MKAYETSATVDDQGQVCLTGVPFAPGTDVNVTISPKRQPIEEISTTDEQRLAAARARMQQLFRTVRGFRMSPKIPREEIYERGSFR